jgi:hypothetical protein
MILDEITIQNTTKCVVPVTQKNGISVSVIRELVSFTDILEQRKARSRETGVYIRDMARV